MPEFIDLHPLPELGDPWSDYWIIFGPEPAVPESTDRVITITSEEQQALQNQSTQKLARQIFAGIIIILFASTLVRK